MEQRSGQTYQIVRSDRVVVSAIVASYNEEQYIGRCLEALLRQRPAAGDIEILVVDGCSKDATRAVVRSFPEYGDKIRLIDNPRRLQVYAWNIGLREMRGEYFAMMTAHAEYSADYFEKCLQTLERSGASAVGGVPAAHGEGPVGRAIAYCMSTPFGVGDARFRYLQQEEECDTVPLIFARKETIEAIGGWDESIKFDEDSDLSYRLRKSGARLVVSPAIGVKYYVRRSFKALWKQMYQYGFWRQATRRKHPRAVPLRVYAPAVLLVGLAASAALAATPARLLSLVIPAMYCGFVGLATVQSVPRIGKDALLVPSAIATMHSAYGVGFLSGLFRKT